MTKAIMIQGAGSNVGKSLVVAGLCRHFTNAGLRVLPFKPQNMSNNAAVTVDGGEIGRAQALQARACKTDPHTDMNPVLLKPETDTGAQVILNGKRFATLRARDYGAMKAQLLPAVLESFHRLAKTADLILIEGAGSPAEINLRTGDIANMGFAEAADIPVLLIGDIDRGGVIAQLVGTHAVLPEPDRRRIKAYLINKFRGDASLFDDGLTGITTRTGWPSLGILPWFEGAGRLPAEDVMDIASTRAGPFKIVVPHLSRMANFDDLDPLKMEPGISVAIIPPGQPLPADANLILIPGSKSTIGDLAYLRAQGWDIDIAAHARRGTHILGLCGGYQMLGRIIADPEGIEGEPGETQGLGLLNVTTIMRPAKRLALSNAHDKMSGFPVSGYEIHIGETEGPDCAHAWLSLNGRDEGAASGDGRIRGTYLHGLFVEDNFRAAYLARIGAAASTLNYGAEVDKTLDALAAHLAEHIDTTALLRLASELKPRG